jgi:hypothetical protein
VELAWGSISTKSVLFSAAAMDADRLIAVVVLPTPPFWLAMHMILVIFQLATVFPLCTKINPWVSP